MHKILAPFNLSSTTGSHVMYLEKMLENKTWVLVSTQKKLELLGNKNAPLAQKLKNVLL